VKRSGLQLTHHATRLVMATPSRMSLRAAASDFASA
jgi:hypothetical protein